MRIGESITGLMVGVVSLSERVSMFSKSWTISGVGGRSLSTETSLFLSTKVLSTTVGTIGGAVSLVIVSYSFVGSRGEVLVGVLLF